MMIPSEQGLQIHNKNNEELALGTKCALTRSLCRFEERLLKLIMDERTRIAQSRVTFVRLVSMQMRLMELWREAAGGHQEALVQMAVGAINGDRVTRVALDPSLRSLSNPLPVTQMTKCNLSSISAGTGLNRETVRRIVNRLIESGPLVRSADGSIQFIDGWSQGPETERLGQAQLQEFSRTANLLLRDGVLFCEEMER